MTADEFLRRITSVEARALPKSVTDSSEDCTDHNSVDSDSDDINKPSTSSSAQSKSKSPNLTDGAQDIVDRYTCKICMNDTVTVAVQPCNHLSLCVKCWEKWELEYFKNLTQQQIDTLDAELLPKCPFCNTAVKTVQKYFI